MLNDVIATTQPGDEDLAAWDAFVESVPYADVTQLTSWAKIRASAGYTPVYVFVKRDSALIAGAQLLRRRIPIIGWIYYLSGGPLVAPDIEERADLIEKLTDSLKRIFKRRGRLIFIQPPLGAPDVSDALRAKGFRPSKAAIAPPASLRIDLTRDVEEIRAGLKRKLRNWSRRWSKSGVTVRIADASEIETLARLIRKSAAANSYQPLSADYITQMYKTLAPTGNAILFVGEADGVPVAATLYTRCGGVLRARLTGFDRDSSALKLNVPSAIAWNAILWAREAGLQWFDLGGIRPATAQAMLAGQSLDQTSAGGNDFFKLCFGGEPILMPPAVETAAPRLILDTLDVVQSSTWGRSVISDLQRRMRGGIATTR